MATITINLSTETEVALKAHAQAQGMSLEQWLVQTVEQYASPVSLVELQKADPAEWARRFHDWAESHQRDTPLLSDEAVGRHSI